MGFGDWLNDKMYNVGQGVVDTYHFSRSLASQMFGDNSYTPPAFSQPVSADPAEREEQKKEANRYTGAAKTIAMNTETGYTIGADLATLGTGKIISGASKLARASRFLAPTLGSIGVEEITNARLAARGEAPLRSWTSFLPIIGDEHYRNGGSPDDHPQVLEYRRMQAEQAQQQGSAASRENVANPSAGKTPGRQNAPTPQATASHGTHQDGMFGNGSLLGAALGALGFIFNPVIGAILVIAGGLLGQSALKAFTQQQTPPAGMPAQPTNIPAASNQNAVQANNPVLTTAAHGLPSTIHTEARGM